MPPADKRARKKENARAAREQREAAVQRRKRMRTARNVGIVVAIFVGVIVLLNVAGGDSKKKATPPGSTTTTTAPVALPAGCVKTVPKKSKKPVYKLPPAMTIDVSKTYVAHINTTCGDFDVTLDPKDAPKTVNSFVLLAKEHFYDGLTFHRVAKDFVIQGGDPKGDGTGGPGYSLPTEPPKDGYRKGSVAMANAGADTTGSQFFVALTEQGAKKLGGPPYLYSALGEVTKGFDVVQKLGSLYNKAQTSEKPSAPLYMFKVTITES